MRNFSGNQIGVRRFVLLAFSAALMSSPLIAPAAAQESTPTEYVDSIIVRYEPGVLITDSSGDPTGTDALSTGFGFEIGDNLGFGYRTIEFSQSIPLFEAEKIAVQLSRTKEVSFAEPNNNIYQFEAPSQNLTSDQWGLDRLDQEILPLNSKYEYFSSGSGILVYVVDSGVEANHPEFITNSLSRVATGFTAPEITSTFGPNCSSHGTHVAGIIGSNTYGVAKSATIVPVRVFPCTGNQTTEAAVLSGLNYIKQNHPRGQSGVVNLSFGFAIDPAVSETLMESTIKELRTLGLTVVIAAGNSNTLSCSSSPARLREAITVNSSGSFTGQVLTADVRSSFSNFGACSDIYAPGANILSTMNAATTGFSSGTSMATPFVSGIVANLLSEKPNLTPDQVWTAIKSEASQSINSGLSEDTNLLIHQPKIGWSASAKVSAALTPPDISQNQNNSSGDQLASGGSPPAAVPVAAPAAPAAPAPSGAISQSVGSRRVINVSVSAPAGSTTAIQIQARKNQRVAYKTASGKTRYRTVKVTFWRTVSTTPTVATADIRVRSAGTYRVLVNTPSGPIEGSPFRVR